MKNNIWFLVACTLFFVAGYTINNTAISFPRYKVAVVDITKVLEKSPELQSLKTSQEKQMQELNTMITKAQNEIVNAPDQKRALELEAKYKKEIETKRNTMDDEYNKQIDKITTNVKSIISKEAQKTEYNLVLPAGMVISGGDDITQNVINDIK